MIDISSELVTIIMFGGLLFGVLLGFPLAFVIGGIAMIAGLLTIGSSVFTMFRLSIFGILTNYIFICGPLFIFMGVMVEKSGTAERLYAGLYLWLGKVRGGLAIATILLGTIVAATVGIIAASVIMLGLIAAPSMMERGYNKELVAGSVCAGGTLGILIPPSVMIIFYGPIAGISVGKLFMAAFIPGFILSGLYCSYIAIRCLLQPHLAPAIPVKELDISFSKKLHILFFSMLPPLFLILMVLGSIFFGIASPTEAAGMGAFAATLLALFYHRLNWATLKETALYTMRIISAALLIGICSVMFTAVFLKLGGGEVVGSMLLAAPGGRWGTFAAIMIIFIILGMFMDWVGILFLMVPLISPIGTELGFDPLWFGMMIIVNLQIGFLSPPFAYAIFCFSSVTRPEWGMTTAHIIRGVIPFIILIIIGLVLFTVFPQCILWLPAQMIR